MLHVRYMSHVCSYAPARTNALVEKLCSTACQQLVKHVNTCELSRIFMYAASVSMIVLSYSFRDATLRASESLMRDSLQFVFVCVRERSMCACARACSCACLCVCVCVCVCVCFAHATVCSYNDIYTIDVMYTLGQR